VNPATGVTEGKAWCEATVQRIPEYFDPADDATVARWRHRLVSVRRYT
jgi:hypothetical protein